MPPRNKGESAKSSKNDDGAKPEEGAKPSGDPPAEKPPAKPAAKPPALKPAIAARQARIAAQTGGEPGATTEDPNACSVCGNPSPTNRVFAQLFVVDKPEAVKTVPAGYACDDCRAGRHTEFGSAGYLQRYGRVSPGGKLGGDPVDHTRTNRYFKELA